MVSVVLILICFDRYNFISYYKFSSCWLSDWATFQTKYDKSSDNLCLDFILPSVSQATDRAMGMNGLDVAGLRPFDLVIPFTIQKGEITGIFSKILYLVFGLNMQETLLDMVF